MPARLVVVALGNPIRGDDGVGWAVADEVERRLAAEPDSVDIDVEVERLAVGGLALMERLAGADQAVIVDALESTEDAGGVRRWTLDEMAGRPAAHLDSGHDAPLSTALEAGWRLGAHLPLAVAVVTVGVVPTDLFSEGLSAPVQAAVGPAADLVLRIVRERAARAR